MEINLVIMFIIDFDDTLFATHAYKEARLKALDKIGVSKELFWTTYRAARTNNDGFFTYSDERHAEILVESGFNEKEVLKILQQITNNLKDFLDSDAEFFLETLKAFNQPLVLLSLGDPSHQELKVKNCGIEKYFERMFFVNKSKETVLTDLLNFTSEKDYWLINDKVDESQQLKLKFPNLKIVLKMSPSFPQEIYLKSGFPHFFNLKEILNYVSA